MNCIVLTFYTRHLFKDRIYVDLYSTHYQQTDNYAHIHQPILVSNIYSQYFDSGYS